MTVEKPSPSPRVPIRDKLLWILAILLVLSAIACYLGWRTIALLKEENAILRAQYQNVMLEGFVDRASESQRLTREIEELQSELRLWKERAGVLASPQTNGSSTDATE